MTSLSLRLYLAASAVSAPFWRLLLARRARRGKEDPARLAERLGHAAVPRPPGRLVWFHALGIGEAGALLPLIAAVREARPGTAILLTTGTRTAAEGLARLGLPDGVIHQYAPIDAPGPLRRFLDHWRPDGFVLAELDLWPRMLRALAARGVPMVMVNARLTDHRFRGRMRARGLFAGLWPLFDAILVQDALSAERMAALGAPLDRVRVAGLLKAAADPLPDRPEDRARLAVAIGGRPVWLAAATAGPEHGPLLAAHAAAVERLPGLLLILAPRQPGDAGAAADQAARIFGAPPPRRSRAELPRPDHPVWLADTMGEMGLWYRLAPLAFVGHSLDLPGHALTGKNPFEAARLGAVVLHGPATGNFAESYAALHDAGAAVALPDAEALPDAVLRLLSDPAECATRAAAGQAMLAASGSGLPRTLAAVLRILPPDPGL